MEITQITVNDKIIPLRSAKTFHQRLFGLMGQTKICEALIFQTGSIHTFFMKENIDVIMLNKQKNVVYTKKNLKPNKILIKREAYYTIELPINTLKDTNNIISIQEYVY